MLELESQGLYTVTRYGLGFYLITGRRVKTFLSGSANEEKGE